jgi:hypothetical protein
MSPESEKSQLFSVRVWTSKRADGAVEHRGHVRHVLSREARHFRDWNTLVEFIIEQVELQETATPEKLTPPDHSQGGMGA